MRNLNRCFPLLFLLALLSLGTVRAAPEDPFEPVNRVIFNFNHVVDRAVIRPVSELYTTFTPDPVERGVRNFFGNIGEIRNTSNNLFQGKWGATLTSGGRFTINSTVGILGLFDVAHHIGLEREPEDFGQTLGYWGLPSGPYLVLPVLGPSSVRDSSGKLVDFWLSPLQYTELDVVQRGGLVTLDGIQTRADLLATDNLFSGDSYLVIRGAFLSKQEYDVANGHLESDAFLDEDNGDDEEGFIDESF